MKILSIDFDYFQVVKKEILGLYPDGIDHCPELSEFIWAQHYANPLEKNKLRRVRINKNELIETIDLILSQSENTPVLISYTHKDIYDFIHALAEEKEPLTVVNVDMHHDLCNDNETLDCGNWLSFITEEYKTKLYWVSNPVSLKAYDAPELEPYVLNSIKDVPTMQYDGIFLARSDTWLPPHLDKYFEQLKRTMAQYFTNIKCSSFCMKPRTEYSKIAKSLESASRKLYDRMKSDPRLKNLNYEVI